MIYNKYDFGVNSTYNVYKYNNVMKLARDYIQGYEPVALADTNYIQINLDFAEKLETKEAKVAYMLIELCQSLIGYTKKTAVRDEVMKNIIIVDKVFDKFNVKQEDVLREFDKINKEYLDNKFLYIVDPNDEKALIFYWDMYGWKVGEGSKPHEFHHMSPTRVVELSRRTHNLTHYFEGWSSKF